MEKVYKKEKIPKSNKNTIALQEKFNNEKTLIEIIIGKILGDGYITTEGNLRLSHSIKQKEYIEHCYEILKNYTRSGIKERTRIKDGKENKELIFSTCALLKEYIDLFYVYEEKTNRRIKIIPKTLENMLTLRGLAYWIMDDGAQTKSHMIICTHSFTLEENIELRNILEKKFGLECRVLKTKKPKDQNQFWYYIQITNVPYLWNIIKDYIHPTMTYKFGKSGKR